MTVGADPFAPSWMFPTLGKRNFRNTTKEESCSGRTTSKTTTDTEQLPQRKTLQLLKWQQENSRTRFSQFLVLQETPTTRYHHTLPECRNYLKQMPTCTCVYDFHSDEDRQVGIQSKNLLFLFDRNVYGRPWLGLLWSSRLEEVRLAQSGDSVPTRMSLRPSKNRHCSCRCMYTTSSWWEGRKRKDIDLADPTSFESGTRRETEVGHEVDQT